MIYSLISKFVVLGSKKLKGGKPCLYVKHVIHVRNAHKITSQINLFSTTDLRNQQIRQHHILIYPFFQLSCTKYRQIQKEKQMSNIFRSDLELITEIEKQIGEGILHLEVEGDIAKVLKPFIDKSFIMAVNRVKVVAKNSPYPESTSQKTQKPHPTHSIGFGNYSFFRW